MNIDFELYRIFYVVANHCNITKASEELSISQPAISKSIKNLEEQLGGQLFVRTKRGVVLTEEGKEFYNYIKQAIEYINNAENKFTDLINLETGCIKIGISTTLTKEFLLPFKFGAVSMAKKTDAYLVPFGITGDYKFRSKNLTYRFGKPFKVTNMDLEDANKRLANAIGNLMKKSYRETNKK